MGLSNIVVFDDSSYYYYWVSDLKLFSGKTYHNQLKKIEELNGKNFLGKDSWRMAILEEMELLWTYPAEEISQSFKYTIVEDSYDYIGRFNYMLGDGEHFCARVRKPINPAEPAVHDAFYAFQDDQPRTDIGAWVVCKIQKF